MLDLKLIRDNPEGFDEALKKRGLAPLSSSILALDGERRQAVTALQEAQSRRNQISKDVGKAKAAKREDEAQKLMAEIGALKDAIAAGEARDKDISAKLDAVLAGIPNLPAEDVPVGDESANAELRKWGKPGKFAFEPKQHFELGEALGLMDFETAAKISGSRFVVLKGALARLERALAAFMLDLHTTEFGYQEINPPLLVRDAALFGTGQLPKFEDDLFFTSGFPLSSDELDAVSQQPGFSHDFDLRTQLSFVWQMLRAEMSKNRRGLIPTAEVPLTNLVREAIVDPAALPLRYTAHTPSFRSEAGSAGRDTRGMIRLHQFAKVELVSITTPEASDAEQERMTNCAEEVLKRLGLPYRVIVLATGDMGFSARKTYDLEVWLPGQNAYREISSCSNCGDFQARRMNARYRPEGGKDLRFVHTLNGSGLAVGRTLVAVLENYQQADGSIRIPDVLVPYMGGLEIIAGGR
ncbi:MULTISPECIES: serine--tRNA ligase [Rhodomicrobium]|uniref:serine--tRNA ligase n=1 Tax=Rhodomicrobium TaxID=1068 RepID=UPI001AED09B4|nr:MULTISPECIES: serine--tRNA ligase [Rhodomicrobium]